MITDVKILQKLVRIAEKYIYLDHDDKPWITQQGINEVILAYEKAVWETQKKPKPHKRVLVMMKNHHGNIHTTIAYWIPKFYEEDCGDYEGDADYNEANDCYYWPEGWYESNVLDEIDFMLDDDVLAWRILPQKMEVGNV